MFIAIVLQQTLITTDVLCSTESKICANNDTSDVCKNESAKLRALRAKNVLACQRALRADVLTCLRALRAYVLTS